jgi:hypothetical protein
MASSFSTDLKLELMVTGENAGTWGTKTNTNLELLQQAIAGYQDVSIAGGAQTTALAMTNATLSNARNLVVKLSGTITGNQIVTIPDGIEKTYIIENGTSGAFTVEFKTVSGTGPTFSTVDKGIKFVYSNGTNVIDINANLSASSFEQINLPTQNELRFEDTTGGQYVGFKAPGTVPSSYTLVLPTATGTVDQVIKTDGSGNLSFATVSGGAAWQAVKTSGFTAVAKEGYFCNTTSSAFTATLPVSATIGDFISFVDYAGTFDTNNLTIGRNGHNIQGVAEDLTVAVERAGFTLVYVDVTQGWLLQNK